jgi:DNA polymerase-1
MRVPETADLESHQGKPTGGLFGTLRSINAALHTFRAKQCVVIYDGGVSKRRRKEYPPYKGNRYRDKDDPLYEELDDKTKEFKEKFNYQRSCLLYLLPKLGVHAWRFDGWEADDVIAALCDYFEHEERMAHAVYVVSDDKDMLQLVRENDDAIVKVVRAIAKQVVDVDNFEQIFDRNQQEFELRRIVSGDPGNDNIPGIPGVGKKTIEEIFEIGHGCLPYEYPFTELFEFCDGSSNKRVQRVANNMEIVWRNHELMFLPLEDWGPLMPVFDDKLSVKPDIDLSAVKSLLTKLDIFSILKDLHTWVVPFQRLVR